MGDAEERDEAQYGKDLVNGGGVDCEVNEGAKKVVASLDDFNFQYFVDEDMLSVGSADTKVRMYYYYVAGKQ